MAGKEIRAGGAFIEIYFKNKTEADEKILKAKQQRLDKFAKDLTKAGASIGAIGAAPLAGLSLAFNSFMSRADSLVDMSERLGITTNALQELDYAASQSGASLEDVEIGLKKMEDLIGKAEKGQQSAIKTLQRYGLSADALKSMTPEQQLRAFADAIASQPDQATKAAAANELLGKSFIKLLPMLSGGSAGLNAFAQTANALGLVQKPQDVAAGAKLADMWATITKQTKALADVIGAALAPAMEKVFELIRGVLAWSIKFVDNNRTLVVIVGVVAGVIAALGGAMLLAAGAATIASIAVGVYATVCAFAAAATGTVMLPILLLVAVIGLFVATLVTLSDAWGAVWNAIAGGNITLAFQIIWQSILLQFEKFGATLLNKWADIKGRFLNSVTRAQVELGITSEGDGQKTINSRLADEFKRRLQQDAALGTAQAKLDALKAEAARAAAGLGGEGGLFGLKKPGMPAIAAGDQSGHFGTFNSAIAAMAGRTGALSVEQKQLEALEGMEEDLAVVRKAAEEGGLVFA